MAPKCKFQLPTDYVNKRPIKQTPTEISVVMVVNDLVKVDDDELSYTIDITCVRIIQGDTSVCALGLVNMKTKVEF